jgi:hypothetical protein
VVSGQYSCNFILNSKLLKLQGKNPIIKAKDECVRVIIRCRPMEQKEKDRNCEQVVQMDGKRGLVIIKKPNSNDESKEFSFDAVYDWK